jgi:outer membrane protein OmpA-like peptidoglycan-associated protein
MQNSMPPPREKCRPGAALGYPPPPMGRRARRSTGATRSPRFAAALLASAGVLSGASEAAAQGTAENRAFNLQLFEPPTSPGSLLTFETPAILPHLSLTASAWGSWATPVLAITRGGDAVPLVSNAVQGEAQVALGLFQRLELGFALPLVSQEVRGDDGGAAPRFTSLGDMRASLKIPLLRGRTSLAARVLVSFPTGDDRSYAGAPYWTLAPALLAAHTRGPLTLAGALGLRLSESSASPFVSVNDDLTLHLGARYAIGPRVALSAEGLARLPLNAGPAGYLDGNAVVRVDGRIPVEVFAAGHLSLTRSLVAVVGVGKGLTDAYGASGFRALLGLRWTIERRPCTEGPEDYDGFRDDDFCADPDNDGDGVPDDADRCPNDPEDLDGVLDGDGCADPDNDGDGVLDDADRCPIEPEDHDRFQNDDGCPDLDNDRDGLPDIRDVCPDEAEDRDDFQDDDGCPEPGPDAVVVTRTDSRLLVSQRVYFDYDSDTIKSVSFPLLDEVAATLGRNPDILRLRIEGHTDQAGSAEYNLDLSFRRARSVVEYLAAHGVARARLDYQGFGASRPTTASDVPGASELNRRVEFAITDQSSPTAAAPPPPAAEPRRRHHRRHRDR